MVLEIKKLSNLMGAEATGVDLRKPISSAEAAKLNDALHENIVLCIRNQKLDGPGFVEACRVFGNLMRQVNEELCDPDLPELGNVTSGDVDRHDTQVRVVRGTSWHSDHSFIEKPPSASILYAVKLPSRGGDTSFCNLRAAYKSLPDEMKKQLEGLKARHQFRCSRAPNHIFIKLKNEADRIGAYNFPHPLARQHLPTGEKTLYLNPQRMEDIIGLERKDSDALLDELVAHSENPAFHWNHQWQAGDMLVWDNRCSMHHANDDWPINEERFLYKCILEGEVPV